MPVPIITSKKNRISYEKKKEKKLDPKKRERVRVVVALVQQFVLLGCGPLNLPRHYVCVNVCVCMHEVHAVSSHIFFSRLSTKRVNYRRFVVFKSTAAVIRDEATLNHISLLLLLL